MATFFAVVRKISLNIYVLGKSKRKQDPRGYAGCGYVDGPLVRSRDIGQGFKAVLCGSPRTTSGVGMFASGRFRDWIVSVERFDDRLMKIVVAAKQRLYHFFSAYAPQNGCSDQTKEEFWNLLDEKTVEVSPKDVITVASDLNGHVGATKDGYSCHGGFGTDHVTPMMSALLITRNRTLSHATVGVPRLR
ncbi:unnamed protein product [Heligmosomoides polygyrus]|uniref:Craniofacial development protein 2-like n=1 Tax=Heligmosomoides polygyrus TaxID=6339 RepID=A0A183GL41_HELPZ|nr:unnamed protein product [Heligmosomoides polygyrus]